MTLRPVSDGLLHELVAGSHAEGVTAMDVAATVEHDERILLVVEPGHDFIDNTWQLPVGPVLPGEILTDALAKALACIGLQLYEVTGYLGHHDRDDSHDELVRVFCFAVTVTRPDSVCRSARIGHWWADLEDLPELPVQPELRPDAPAATMTPAIPPECHDPPLAQPLRTSAHGLSAVEAGTDLFIRHGTWLHRSDFRDQFVHIDIASDSDSDIATIDWSTAITALDCGQLPCSSSEGQILRLAASIIEGIPVNLRDTLVGLDSRNLDLVSQAILHTAGR